MHAGFSSYSVDCQQHRPLLNPFPPIVKSIPPLHLDHPSQLDFAEGSTLALAPGFPGIDTHFVVFDRTGSADSRGCSADKATLLGGNQAEWELLEDGIGEVLTGFRIGGDEDHGLGLGNCLYRTGHSGTSLRDSPSLSTALVHYRELPCLGRESYFFRDHPGIRLALWSTDRCVNSLNTR